MSMLLVDWLGRGGIAQISESWVREARHLGLDVTVATRPGRELIADVAPLPAAHAVLEHRALATAAARAIHERRPALVVVQNYVVPVLEAPVYRAARAVGARLVTVVHDHRMHTTAAGTHHGLTGLLRGADDVLAHSHFVGARLARRLGRPVDVIDIPLSVGMLHHAGPMDGERPAVAIHFGVLKRKYKGTDVVHRLAAAGVDGWNIVTAGGDGYVAGLSWLPRFKRRAPPCFPTGSQPRAGPSCWPKRSARCRSPARSAASPSRSSTASPASSFDPARRSTNGATQSTAYRSRADASSWQVMGGRPPPPRTSGLSGR